MGPAQAKDQNKVTLDDIICFRLSKMASLNLPYCATSVCSQKDIVRLDYEIFIS